MKSSFSNKEQSGEVYSLRDCTKSYIKKQYDINSGTDKNGTNGTE